MLRQCTHRFDSDFSQGEHTITNLSQRLWRSVKDEYMYLRAYESASAVRIGLNRYFNFYNSRRSHSSFDGPTLDQVYFKSLTQTKAAKSMKIQSTYKAEDDCSNKRGSSA
ncbi:hypothetical protein [uncultured Desulfuromusa sp.]|uniref:hypothetical protein n=1 Tax=uncultured Desulfuromusa sp. TaxID=219183 RepID=UPI003749654E